MYFYQIKKIGRYFLEISHWTHEKKLNLKYNRKNQYLTNYREADRITAGGGEVTSRHSCLILAVVGFFMDKVHLTDGEISRGS